jgi:hypothetical protein
MSSTLQKYLLSPPAPNTAAGFIDENFAVVDLRRSRHGFSLASSAVTQLPTGLVTPSFDSENIADPQELAEIVLQTAEAAGLSNKKRWAVALPEGAARTMVVALESKPGNRRELNEVISWKIERVITVPTSELRISRQRMSRVAGQERYLVTVAREDVISQYESVFYALGWNTGLLLPRHLGEAQWLVWDNEPGDKMLVSANRSGFTSVIMRNGEPMLVRPYACAPESRTDELHRFALYYRDRLAEQTGESVNLAGMLVLGGINPIEAQQAVSDAIDSEPRLLDPAEFGIDLTGEAIVFDHLAGAAGLATLTWQ